ncbi:MAG: (E)-4-hydroxy-3-methylbut-2-enyl-diphosphate synthase [Bacteroidales bacterium]
MKTRFISFVDYNRFPTHEIKVGNIGIGGNNPIRIQTMTNTNTSDIEATLNQIIRIYNAGADLVRVSVPKMEDVEALKQIKKHLVAQKIDIPIIADIHFNPSLAEAIAPYVEKVRINPGNYVNRSKSAKAKTYSIEDEQKELDEIRQRLAPLLSICKKHNTAIRLGINFASLSWRMINKFGNTPMAMVQSAVEFIDICRTENFQNIIISLKASDIHTTIYANRLFVEEMAKRDWHYPIHVGITEAGLDLEGRVKSAIGIGSLLCDGIGDTVRVSLTEAPEKEIPVAKEIVSQVYNFITNTNSSKHWKHQPFIYQKRSTESVSAFIGGENPIPFLVLAENEKLSKNWEQIVQKTDNTIRIDVTESDNVFDVRKKVYENIESKKPIYLVFDATAGVQKHLIRFSMICGNLFAEGLIDGILLKCLEKDKQQAEQMVRAMLQVTGALRTGNEYISCPSCSRTQFDIEKISREVKIATQKFKGFKIAVMGCVVNGPGEMQDADYGFVGAGNNLLTLYKKGKVIAKNIPLNEAIDVLIDEINKSQQQHT